MIWWRTVGRSGTKVNPKIVRNVFVLEVFSDGVSLLPTMAARKIQTPGVVGPTSLLIGTMSLGLALGMSLLGFWDSWNVASTAWTSRLGDGMREMHPNAVLMIAMVMAYAPPFLMLSTPGNWRRVLLWTSILLLGLAWLPVLALAAWQLPPCLPMAAGIWSGLCAMIYGSRHLLPCEQVGAVIAEPKKSAVREVAVAQSESSDH